MSDNKRDAFTVIFCSVSVVWPGALMLGYPGVMAPYWQSLFNVGEGPLGNTMFFMWLPVGIFMFLVGRWHQRYGTRLVSTIGASICGLNLLIVAYASNIRAIYLWAFLHGVATCAIYNPAVSAAQHWYPHRRGLVSGIVNLFFGISAAVMAPLFSYMLKSMSYISMHLMLGVMVLLVGIVASQFVITPPGPSRQGTGGYGTATTPHEPQRSLTVREALRKKNFWLLWLTWAFQGAGGTSMVIFLTTFGLSRGFAIESAVLLLIAFNVTNGFSRIISGYLSDIAGRIVIMSITFFAAAGAYFLFPYIHYLMTAALLAAVAGFAYGTLITVTAPLVVDCFGLAHFGAIFGIVWSAYGFVSGLLGPSLSGYILDNTNGNFTIVFLYLGLCSMLSGILTILIRAPVGLSSLPSN